MSDADLLPASVLKRKAIVYVRQSTQAQVQFNLESQRQQYPLVEVARQRGSIRSRSSTTISDDPRAARQIGRASRGSWLLVAGHVGAVLCLDASRLARNGRDWHHLLELCGLVEARVIDMEGVYDPCRPNDRLLLGMKGSISEFELGSCAPGCSMPPGPRRSGVNCVSACRPDTSGIATSASASILICVSRRHPSDLQRFRQLGSARGVHLAMAADQVHFPRPSEAGKPVTFDWTLAKGQDQDRPATGRWCATTVPSPGPLRAYASAEDRGISAAAW